MPRLLKKHCLTPRPGFVRKTVNIRPYIRTLSFAEDSEGFSGLLGKDGDFRVAEVSIQEGESLENALRRFKRRVQQEDIIKEIKKHSYYMKPGEKRRAKQALSRKRLRKKQRREQD